MAKADVVNIQGEKVGEVELNDAVWAADIKPYLMHDVVVMQLDEPAPGHRLDEDARRGARRRKEAVAAEGDGPGKGGKLDVARVGRRRDRLRAEAEGVPYVGAQEGEEGGAPLGASAALCRRGRESVSTSSISGTISTKNFAGVMKTLSLSKPLRRRAREERGAGEIGPEHPLHEGAQGRRAQRLRRDQARAARRDRRCACRE